MAAVLYLVGALVTAFAPDFVVMVIGRFVYGIGIGLVIYLIPNLYCCLLALFIIILCFSQTFDANNVQVMMSLHFRISCLPIYTL